MFRLFSFKMLVLNAKQPKKEEEKEEEKEKGERKGSPEIKVEKEEKEKKVEPEAEVPDLQNVIWLKIQNCIPKAHVYSA